jgi:hypothetical protein
VRVRPANEERAFFPLDIRLGPPRSQRPQRAPAKSRREAEEHERVMIGILHAHTVEEPRRVGGLERIRRLLGIRTVSALADVLESVDTGRRC